MEQRPAQALPARNRAASELLGREKELEEIARAIASAREGEGVVLAVDGVAGIGKTALVRAALGMAAASGMRTLLATGTPLETAFSFGIARQLLDPLRRDLGEDAWSELSSGAARFASRALDERALEVAGPGDNPSFATLHGLYWLTANLATTAALVLAIDDAQWADRPSLRFLSHLVRRLEGLPVLVVLAVRTGDPPTDTRLLSEMLAAAEPVRRLAPLEEPRRRRAGALASGPGHGRLTVRGVPPRDRRQSVPARCFERCPGGGRG